LQAAIKSRKKGTQLPSVIKVHGRIDEKGKLLRLASLKGREKRKRRADSFCMEGFLLMIGVKEKSVFRR